MYQTLTAPTGHANGIPAISVAIDDPIIESSPGECFLSICNGEIVSTTSFTIHFGNIGLSGLSVSLA
jgi:hypothetical protein